MALESFDELKAHLTENIANREKTLHELDEQLAGIRIQLERAKEAQASAQAQCEEAERRFIDAQRKREHIGKTVRELERQKSHIPNSIKRAKELNDDDMQKISQLERRADVIRTRVNMNRWSHLFVWGSVADMSEPLFEKLVGQLDCLFAAIKELREATAEHKEIFEATRADEGEGGSHESMFNLARAGHRVTEARKQYTSARGKVIEAQLLDLEERLADVRNWPPGAHQDAHDVSTMTKFQMKERIAVRRRSLEEAWPKLPD